MVKRRTILGKKLLIASAGLAGVSLVSCARDTVANLVAPPEDGGPVDASDMDADDMDVIIYPDAVVANLVAPPEDGGDQMDVIIFPDALVANLVAPPEDGGGT